MSSVPGHIVCPILTHIEEAGCTCNRRSPCRGRKRRRPLVPPVEMHRSRKWLPIPIQTWLYLQRATNKIYSTTSRSNSWKRFPIPIQTWLYVQRATNKINSTTSCICSEQQMTSRSNKQDRYREDHVSIKQVSKRTQDLNQDCCSKNRRSCRGRERRRCSLVSSGTRCGASW